MIVRYTFLLTLGVLGAAFAADEKHISAAYKEAGLTANFTKQLEAPAPAHSAAASAHGPERHLLTRSDVMKSGPLKRGALTGLSAGTIQVQGWSYLNNGVTPLIGGEPIFSNENGDQIHPHLVGGYNIYSPFLLLQPNEEAQQSDLIMYFSGWQNTAALQNGTDSIYRVKCHNAFGPCTEPRAIISHDTHAELSDGRFLYQIADPTIVKLNDSTNTGRDFYLMYATVDACSENDPEACKRESMTHIQEGTFFEETNYIYYATSWADNGYNWSKLHKLNVENLWLPSAVNTPDGVYIYGNSTQDGAVYRVPLGEHGVEAGEPEAVQMLDSAGNEIVWGISNVDVTYRTDEDGNGYYQILAERFVDVEAYERQITQIDLFQSADGLVWEMAAEGVVVPQPGAHRVNTPAAHPLTHCWLYFGENPAIEDPEAPAYAAMASLDFNIYGYDWCSAPTDNSQ